MKTFERLIPPFQENDFFKPIRNKLDYAHVILQASKLLILNIDTTGMGCTSGFKLIVDKMSRLFLLKDKKYYSVSFPMTVSEYKGEVEIRTYSGSSVNNENISAAISVLNSEGFKLNPSPTQFLFDSDRYEHLGLELLEVIFQFESCYIRYDVDPERENGKLHPLMHLDINYSSYGTFKLGMSQNIDEGGFHDLLNISTDCAFLEKNDK